MAGWVSLLPPLTAAESAEYARMVAGAGGLAAAAMIAARSGYFGNHDPAVDEVKGWSDEQRRLAALRIHADAVRSDWPPDTSAGRALTLLARHGVRWTRADLVWSLHLLADEPGLDDGSAQRLPAIIAASLEFEQLNGLGPALQAVMDDVSRSRIPMTVRVDLVRLIGTGVDRTTRSTVPAHLLHAGDAFGPATKTELADILAAPGVNDVLLHSASLSKPVPPAKWSRAAEPMLASAGGAVRAILDRFTTFGRYVHDDTDVLLRGLTCVLDHDPSDEATALIGRVALAAGSADPRSLGYPYAPRTAAAAVEILAMRGGDGPVQVLARLSVSVKNKALLTRVQGALQRLGALRGWEPDEVHELAVDDHGLDRDGRRTWNLDGYTAIVEVGDDKARLRFERDGKPLKGVPAAVKESPVLAEARDLVKQIGKTLLAERTRIEALLSADRTWSYADWVARYLQHPISAVVGRRLIWQASTDGKTWTAGLPEHRDGAWMLADRDDAAVLADPLSAAAPITGSAEAALVDGDDAGNTTPDHGTGRIRLWHPILADPVEVAAWRDHVTVSGLRQPFKQAFREVYLRTPAEEQTETYSNRFAAHILRYRQANALMRVRGWQAGYLGSWSGGQQSEATKLFGGQAWRASFFHDMAGDLEAPRYDVQFCTTDQVRFARRDGALWTTAPLAEVPTRVFSEAMRDVDLFVGVTSIATDDTWADRGEDRFHQYWVSASFGELTASAEVRRDVLARILPKLKISAQCELRERYLRVRGTLRAYKIHLGSGNILMEPNDAYLCIVPERGKPQTVRLPFDDDEMLSIILSKAMLLAADDKITDRTILRQLSH
jgi:hypothetical protein